MSVQDGLIAAIALVNGGRLASHKIKDSQPCGLDLISPWNFCQEAPDYRIFSAMRMSFSFSNC